MKTNVIIGSVVVAVYGVLIAVVHFFPNGIGGYHG